MRTQQYIQVEAIVAKYKNLASKTEAVKKTIESCNGFYVPEDFPRTEYIEQLLGHIYQLRAGCEANKSVTEYYSRQTQYYIKELLSEKEEQYLVDNFAEFAELALSNLSIIASFSSPEFDEPTEWSDLVPYLIENKSGKIFIGKSNKGREFVGLGDCELTVCGGFEDAAIRALACGKTIEKYSDMMTEGELFPGLQDAQFDAAIVDIHSIWANIDISTERCFEACNRIVKDGGDILLCLSKEDILDENTISMRNYLKKEKMLQEVIQLPSGNILLHIVKKPHDTLVMCDASTLSLSSDERVVDVELLKKEVSMAGMPEREEYPLMHRYNYDMLNADILLPAYYLYFPKNGEPVSSFCHIAGNIILSDECKQNEKVVTVNHLSNVFSKGEFKVDDLPSVKNDRIRRYYRIEGPAVVMAISKQDIAIGYITESHSFLVPKNLYVLKPTTSKGVDVRYLAGKLLSLSVKQQVTSLVSDRGANAKLPIMWPDLVRIDTPSPSEQQQFIQSIMSEDYAMQEKFAVKQELGLRHSIRLRKHALAQNISAFDSLFRALEFCMKEHKGQLKASDLISPVSPMTASEAMQILHANLETICSRVNQLTDEKDWGKCESIEPQEFIEEYEKLHKNATFHFKHLWDEWEQNIFSKDVFDKKTGKLLFHKGETMNATWFPRKALTQVFDNIVANACAHGFKDKSRNDYIIQTSWHTDGLNMVVKISNNGTPLPKDVDTDFVLEYGYSTALNQDSHGGIGGGEIAEIMRKYGGDVKIESSPEKAFTVTYVLTMPLASLY